MKEESGEDPLSLVLEEHENGTIRKMIRMSIEIYFKLIVLYSSVLRRVENRMM